VVAERLFATGLCLPSGSSLSEGDLDRIAGIVRAAAAVRPAADSAPGR
jgi:dTDP-4-amino-4,6-dideoxygalactose transaminase